ncbi:MAG: hypothetical protein C5B54_08845 [Acidobacteria bacterium]|nr:MAG: hypothetical protein C5B54_08845 [Acidobacteriota bacterium]
MDATTQEAIYESLETLSNADQYYRWLHSRVKSFIRGKVLEIGSGIGNFAQWGKTSATEYHLSDADPRLVQRLSTDFGNAFQWNLYEPFPRKDVYDTVVILNVIEHLEDDTRAIQAIYERLVPGGNVIIMVPAMQFLYGSMDRAFGHFRRYTKKTLCELVEKARFTVRKKEYVNVIGMLGWYVYGRILNRENLPQQLCSRFNLVLPLLYLERPIASVVGLSLILVAQK